MNPFHTTGGVNTKEPVDVDGDHMTDNNDSSSSRQPPSTRESIQEKEVGRGHRKREASV